jgi:hypothetical protein
MLSFGVYPDIGLKDARTKRDEARNLLTKDVDPGEHKKATKAAKVERSANSFEVICRECAYSGEAGQRFHAKLDTHSRASWTVGA